MIVSRFTRWLGGRAGLGEAGIAGTELALAAPMLALLMTGGFDFGRVIYEQNRVASAANAGIQYATASSGNLTNSTGIIAAARADASDTSNGLTVTTQQCTCPTGAALCSTGANCTGSTVAGTYVQVAVSESISTLVNYPFVASPFTLSGQALARVQ